MSGKHHPKYKKVDVALPAGTLTLYTGERVRAAFHALTEHMDVYLFTRLQLVMKAVYEQGMKHGRAEVIEQLEAIKKDTNYLPPGRPKK